MRPLESGGTLQRAGELRERMRASKVGDRSAVRGMRFSEGVDVHRGGQGSSERDEGWRPGEGTWLDSGVSLRFGSGET